MQAFELRNSHRKGGKIHNEKEYLFKVTIISVIIATLSYIIVNMKITNYRLLVVFNVNADVKKGHLRTLLGALF